MSHVETFVFCLVVFFLCLSLGSWERVFGGVVPGASALLVG